MAMNYSIAPRILPGLEIIALGCGLERSLGGLGDVFGGLGGSWGAFWRVCSAT